VYLNLSDHQFTAAEKNFIVGEILILEYSIGDLRIGPFELDKCRPTRKVALRYSISWVKRGKIGKTLRDTQG
jgi:hypothetical protein